jgi:ubiquinone/menaquinone biosynthesis C-methylase UbiE
MLKDLPFNMHAAEYDAWFEKHPGVFESELAAIKNAWPAHKHIKSLEIGSATGRFSKALEITEGLEPAGKMCDIAEARGVNTMRGIAEDLPYGDLQFDVVLMNCCISYLENIERAFVQAYRVLKYGGYLLVGFIDKNSRIGNYYQNRRTESIFYKHASFFSVKVVEERLRNAGFSNFEFSQTLFDELENIKEAEAVRSGYGDGSFVLIKAIK